MQYYISVDNIKAFKYYLGLDAKIRSPLCVN